MTALHRFLFVLLLLSTASCSPDAKGAGQSNAPASGDAKTVGTGGFEITNPTAPRPYYHDFGSAPFGGRLKHTFLLKNVEGRALTIHDMLPSCGCTVPRVSYVTSDGERVSGVREKGRDLITIPAGAIAEVEISIDTTLVETPNIDKLSQVRLRCDSDANPYLTLELHLIVVLAFRAVPSKLDLGEVPQSVGKSARTDISVCVRGNPSQIRAIASVEGTFTADLQESKIGGERVWILTATAPPGLALGPARGSVVLTTTGLDGTGDGAAFTVPILAQIVTDIVVHPGVLQFQNLDRARGGRAEAEVLALVPGARVRVLASHLEGEASDDLVLEVVPVDPGDDQRAKRHAIRLSSKPSLSAAAFHGTLVLELDDPATPRITIPYAGNSH